MLWCGMVPAVRYGIVKYGMMLYFFVWYEVYGIITVRYGRGVVLSCRVVLCHLGTLVDGVVRYVMA